MIGHQFVNISQKQTFGSPFAAVCIGNVYIADSEIPGLAVSLEIGSNFDFAKNVQKINICETYFQNQVITNKFKELSKSKAINWNFYKTAF